MLHQRHYTSEQANDEVPVVRAVVRRLQRAKRTLAEEGFDPGFTALTEVVGGAWPGMTRARAALDAALGFEQLEDLDLVVRDLDAGLVDFPAVRDGHEIYLCWQIDEPAVGHWHAPETGFAGRLPLERGL
jgi:hypothetical protein